MLTPAPLLDFLRQQRDARLAAPAARPFDAASYTGSTHPIYGVTVPALRAFVRQWTAPVRTTLDYDSWLVLLDTLYRGESFEERTAAGLLLAQFGAHRRRLRLDQFEGWLDQLVGWAEVDSTCQSGFSAADLLARWTEWDAFLRRLTTDANANKRRASLVLLVRPVRESADPRLWTTAADNATALVAERDRLITKPVSWLMREAAKQHTEAVRAWLGAHRARLPAASLREIETKLTTGTKRGRQATPPSHPE